MKLGKDFYKAKKPVETIKFIRDIFYKLGIFVVETSDFHEDFYHSHLTIANKGLSHLRISTNGKGRDPEFSLASAYAEMMERLQNNLKFLFVEKYAVAKFTSKLPENTLYRTVLEKKDLILDYLYYPDEKEISWNELLTDESGDFFKLLRQNASYIKKNYPLDNKVICVPYYNVFKDNITHFPVKNWITGSNGMCAGNTPEEALVQGICEIFERFAIRNIFLNDIKPPEISIELFLGTGIYNKILKLKTEKNIEVIVFDCSLGIELPVIGTLIIYKNIQKYRLEFAGATDPVIALERCLTEHFQPFGIENKLNDINRTRSSFDKTIDERKVKNFYRQFSDATGELDMSNWLLKDSSYIFTGFKTINGSTHKEELDNLLELIKDLNFNIYIRDNSILGFPSFHVVIPGMSEVAYLYNEDDLYVELIALDLNQSIINLKSLTKQQIYNICKERERHHSKTRPVILNFKNEILYNNSKKIDVINEFLLLASMFYYVGDLDKSIKCVRNFIKSKEDMDTDDDLNYFYCVIFYLELKNKKNRDEDIENELLKVYNEELVYEVIEDLKNPEKALQYYDLPTCFDCKKCPIKDDCRLFDVLVVIKKIHNHINSNININQLSLKQYLI